MLIPKVLNTEPMGLDTVEIVLRTEETFNINLPDNECSQVITVGDLYRLVLRKLELPYVRAKEIEAAEYGRNRSHLRMASLFSWSPPDVWLTLKGIVVDQRQVSEENVKEEAAFQRDLGCDSLLSTPKHNQRPELRR
jgi:acyl carrier protein